MDVLKGVFGGSGSLDELKLKRNYKPLPLRRKDDIEYEVRWQTSKIESEGHQILIVASNKYNEQVILYRLYYGDDQDDINITFRIRIISDKRVKIPYPNIHLHVYLEDQHIHIADIQIEGNYINRGYGSIVMDEILKLARQLKIKFISGMLAGVD